MLSSPGLAFSIAALISQRERGRGPALIARNFIPKDYKRGMAIAAKYYGWDADCANRRTISELRYWLFQMNEDSKR
jgi:hypothetical protein